MCATLYAFFVNPFPLKHTEGYNMWGSDDKHDLSKPFFTQLCVMKREYAEAVTHVFASQFIFQLAKKNVLYIFCKRKNRDNLIDFSIN